MTVVISGDTGISPVTASGTSASVDGMTVGRGGGEVSTNTAVGASALNSTTSGGSNTAVGYQSLYSNQTGIENTAVGQGALYSNTASNNTAVGRLALNANTTGTGNSALGQTALYPNTTGSYNTAVGQSALFSNTTASDNTAVGYQALFSNTTGYAGVSIGRQAGYSTTTGVGNTYMGYLAGYTNTTNGNNTYIGNQAGYSATGATNTYLGKGAGYSMTSGSSNVILGGYSGNQNSIDIRTASNNCIVSDGDGNPQIHSNSSSWVGTQWGSIDVTQGAATAGTANSFGITSGTATPIFGGGNYFSGVFIINEFSQTGEVAIIITGGNALKIVSQSAATYVVSSSPTSGQIGIYLSGSVVVVKPGVTGTSNYRIIAFRTRGSQ